MATPPKLKHWPGDTRTRTRCGRGGKQPLLAAAYADITCTACVMDLWGETHDHGVFPTSPAPKNLLSDEVMAILERMLPTAEELLAKAKQ